MGGDDDLPRKRSCCRQWCHSVDKLRIGLVAVAVTLRDRTVREEMWKQAFDEGPPAKELELTRLGFPSAAADRANDARAAELRKRNVDPPPPNMARV
mmetsp:Transcript_23193/g.64816  ORF Transcript_23193/g.64816 Transcript_23193/m.64816 type:complete len:97 (-) Transcript_23193:153-443(-)